MSTHRTLRHGSSNGYRQSLCQGSSDGYFLSALNENVNDHRRKKEKESGVSQSSSSKNPSFMKKTEPRLYCKENEKNNVENVSADAPRAKSAKFVKQESEDSEPSTRKISSKTMHVEKFTNKTSTGYKHNFENESFYTLRAESSKNRQVKEEAKTQSTLNDSTIFLKKKEQELRAQSEHELSTKKRQMEREMKELRAQFEYDMSIKMEKWKANMDANYQIKYNKSIAANERVVESIIEKFKLETEAKIQLGFDKVLSNTFPIANLPINKHGNIVSALSKPGDKWVIICSVNMSNAPWRITSRNQEMQLGENGQFMVQRNIVSQVRRVVYVVRGEVTFMAECPDSKLPALVLKGNVGTCTICWEAVNYAHTAGGTTIQGAEGLNQVAARRRFYFQFNCNPSLSVVLYHMFYDNQKLLEEFFNTTGMNGFTVECFYHAPSTPQQRKDKYGGVDPDEPSQNIFPYWVNYSS